MDDDANKSDDHLPTNDKSEIPEGSNAGEQQVVKSYSGSKVMVLETLLKECGLIVDGTPKDNPDSLLAQGSRLPEVERQRWMRVRLVWHHTPLSSTPLPSWS